LCDCSLQTICTAVLLEEANQLSKLVLADPSIPTKVRTHQFLQPSSRETNEEAGGACASMQGLIVRQSCWRHVHLLDTNSRAISDQHVRHVGPIHPSWTLGTAELTRLPLEYVQEEAVYGKSQHFVRQRRFLKGRSKRANPEIM